MENDSKFELDPSKGDVVHVIASTLIESVPFAGPFVSKLLGLVWSAPREKRLQEFVLSLDQRFSALENEHRIRVDDLSKNEVFQDILYSAVDLAIKTSQEEKTKALRNAIINTSQIPTPDAVKSQVFLNLISTMTDWHILILKFLSHPTEYYNKNKIQIPTIIGGALSTHLYTTYDFMSRDYDLVDQIIKELRVQGLHQAPDLRTMTSQVDYGRSLTTPLGAQFVEFISDFAS